LEISVEVLKDAGMILGSIGTGIVLGVTKVFPLSHNKKQRSEIGDQRSEVRAAKMVKLEALELSEETGGTKHISQEGLSKINKLAHKLETEYLSVRTHDLICAREKSEMMRHISETMEMHTVKVINAIKGGRGG
jgi:hypothetical protein